MPKKPRIAIQNLHKLPNLSTFKIHNYALELVKNGHIDYLYFSERKPFKNFRNKLSLLNELRKKYGYKELGLDKVKFIFSEKSLNKKCDILLNFNNLSPEEFTEPIKRFKGIKIFHIMDYFWSEPGSEKYKRLKEYNIDYLMSYASSDKHCKYFRATFPEYIGKVIPVPFGYADRFKNLTHFEKRINKCVAIGSVNPMRPSDADPYNYEETAAFYENETWFHKFRRMIVEHVDELRNEVDSMLPVFPQYKDHRYDIVKKLNEYKMFTCDESIFYFPAAKAYEGPASGTVMVCSDHQCFKGFGFKDGENCIMHSQLSIESLKERIALYQKDQGALSRIAKNGEAFVNSFYSQKAVADNLSKIYAKIYNECITANKRADLSNITFWPTLQ